MNIVDIIIIAILALSVLVGLYRGFVASVASLGSCALSIGLSFWLSPKLVDLIKGNPDFLRTLMSYTDASSRLGDLNLSLTNVGGLTQEKIAEVLTKVNLPEPLSLLLKNNLTNQIYGAAANVGDYVSQTIVGAVLSVIAFILCFIVIFILSHFLLGFLKAIFKFPVLKQLNSLVGGVFGLLRGILLCFIAFTLLPLLQTVLPLDMVQEAVSASSLAPFFNSGNLILAVMRGHL